MKPLNHTVSSDSRLKIEAILKEATKPLSAAEVSELSGVSISITRTHLGNGIHKGRIRNLSPNKRGASLYVWGKEPVNVTHRQRFVPEGEYDGAELRPFTGRIGAMDAYSIPSRGF
jgi:hypothetical protein